MAASGGRDGDPPLLLPEAPGTQKSLSPWAFPSWSEPFQVRFWRTPPFPHVPPSRQRAGGQHSLSSPSPLGLELLSDSKGGQETPTGKKIFIIPMMGIKTTLQPEGSSSCLAPVMRLPLHVATAAWDARALPTAAMTLPAQNPADLEQQRRSSEQSWSCLLPPGWCNSALRLEPK